MDEKTFWNKLLEMWDKSVITQSILTLVVIGTACYLWIAGRGVPEELYILAGTIVGFFFGSKSQLAAHDQAVAIREAGTRPQ